MEMVQGKHKILLFRNLKDRTEEAAKLVFQTEHTFSFSRSLDSIVTKDGTLIKVGELESTVSIAAIQAVGDPVAKMLQDAALNGEKLELWEVTVDEGAKVGDEYPAIYCRGYLDSWELPAGAEGEATISSNFKVELKPQFGMTELTAAQQEAVQYAFATTEAVPAP